MQGIDISSWQSGIDLKNVTADFVVVKSTQGTSYTNPEFYKQAESTLLSNKLLGIYHYASGENPITEANHFLNLALRYKDVAVYFLDWESGENKRFGKNDSDWCDTFIDYVKKLTGKPVILYVQESIKDKFKNQKLWIAQYANMKPTGYQDKPWNEGKYNCIMRQYTSCGRIKGYNGNLDLNKFYGSKDDWNNLIFIGSGKWVLDNIGWWYKRVDGSYPKNQWLKLDAWYYFDDRGYAVKGWKWINGKCYYFGNDCRMARNMYIRSTSNRNFYHWVNDSGAWEKESDSWDVSKYIHN